MVIDDYTRECLATEIERGFSSRLVISALERIAYLRGVATDVAVHNGAELMSHAMLRGS